MRLDELDRLLAGRDVDARFGVGQLPVGRAHAVGGFGDRARDVQRARLRFEHVLRVVLGDGYGVVAGEARGAERLARRIGGGDEMVEVEVRERVDTEVERDLADLHVGREQVGALAGVETVEARPAVRRRRHPEVHLGRARFAQQRDDLARRGAAHDRVVDDDQPLALDVVAQRVQLEPHVGAALLLVRLDERAPDVAVLHEPVAVGNPGGARESPARRARPTPAPASPCRPSPAPGGRAPRPCAGARRARCGRRAACRGARCRRTRTGRASAWARRSGSSARRPRRWRPSRRARRRGRSAPTRSSAAVSLASTQPPSVLPSTSGRKP